MVLKRYENSKLENHRYLGLWASSTAFWIIFQSIWFSLEEPITNPVLLIVPLAVLLSGPLSVIFGLLFTQTIFYRDRKSPFRVLLFLAIFTLIYGLGVFFLSITTDNISALDIALSESMLSINFRDSSILLLLQLRFLMQYILITILGIWQFYATLRAYMGIKSYKIEPFVKKRYLFFLMTTIFLIYTGLNNILFLLVDNDFLLHASEYVLFILIIPYSILVYLLWVPPDFFRNYLNRNFMSLKEEFLLEEEILKKLRGE